MSTAVPTWAGVAASLALVAVAVAVAWRQRFTPASSQEVGPGGQGEVEE